MNKEGKVRIVSIDQQECVNQFLSKYDDIPVIRNINSPMANKYQILADDTLLEGEVVNKYQSIISVLMRNRPLCVTGPALHGWPKRRLLRRCIKGDERYHACS